MGDIEFSPASRAIKGFAARVAIEPRAARVFSVLAEAMGETVSREALFEHCWGSAAIGDDSLNRAIYQLRKALVKAGSVQVSIETVAAKGYALLVTDLPIEQACAHARRSWRMGLAKGDFASISALQSAIASSNDASAEAWGLLALQLCRAAEYEPIEVCEDLVARCEAAAERALELDPKQADAAVALSSLRPLFGDWYGARTRLLAILDENADNFAARHELAVLEMATGRVSAAIPLIIDLLEADPLAATLHYKRGYHLFCLGDHDAMDRVLDNALQIWPRHPAIWQCRSMTLAFTSRAAVALELLDDEDMRPAMPPQALAFHTAALRAIIENEGSTHPEGAAHLVEMARWQSTAVAAIMYLSCLDMPEEAMSLCENYYLREGLPVVRLRHNAATEPSINDLHRRATQPLFLPVTANLRKHQRFDVLCERIGLAEYWEKAGISPDFRAEQGPRN